jgi:hypothetical protein
MIKPYIAAVSTKAIPKIVIVRKKLADSGLSQIILIDFLDIIHSPIPTHNQANQIANHAHIDKYDEISVFVNN